MTATPIIDPQQFLHEQLAQASPDLIGELLRRSSTRCCRRRPTLCAASSTASVPASGPTGATGIGLEKCHSTPAMTHGNRLPEIMPDTGDAKKASIIATSVADEMTLATIWQRALRLPKFY